MIEKGHTVEVAAQNGDGFDVTIRRDRVETKFGVDEVTVNDLPLEAGVVVTIGGEDLHREAVKVEHKPDLDGQDVAAIRV